jgi:hypothetical protein
MARPYERCCEDCAEFGAEYDNQCEVFNGWVASSPLDFGEVELTGLESVCKRFRKSNELLRYEEDLAAQAREDDRRETAWQMGNHA